MRVCVPGFALICSSLALGCSSDESAETPDGGTQGTGGTTGSGSGGSTGGSGGSSGGSGGSSGSSGASSGGSGASTDASGGSTDGSAGSAGSLGSSDSGSGDSGIDASEVRCVDMPPVFPALDRACWDNLWCAIGFHQTDCCGNLTALGMLHPEIVRFEAAEKICKSQYPACGCPTGPITTDTGQTTTDASKIAVECRAGACTTYLP